MTTEQKERDLQEIGKSAYESLAEMVAALECDYERLAELREERTDVGFSSRLDTDEDRALADKAVAEWDELNGEELAELIAQASIDGTECESREDAEQRIQEDPLSIEVASDWTVLGEPLQAEKFNILLCTGGPAVRIVGELSDGEPSRAWLEVQDWFTPWIEYRGTISKTDPNAYDVPSQDVLLTYARCFYFGD
jgi:hypothetical protein